MPNRDLLRLVRCARNSRADWDAEEFLIYNILSYVKCFDSTLDDDDSANYYMEREWRVIGGVRFSIQDVSRIIIPSAYDSKLREHVPEYYGQVSFTATSVQ